MSELQLGWRDHTNALIANKMEALGLGSKSILEVGAGDSQWLPYLAKKYPASRVAGLDYSSAGCDKLRARADALGAEAGISVHQEDLFAPYSALHGQFDLVLSFGVVEHFSDLAYPLRAIRRYLRDGGIVFSLIPNMAGILGYMTQRFNRTVYDMHNPHDWQSFLQGHKEAGLTVLSGGYLGSSNFGVLSACFERRQGLAWLIHVYLSRVSKAIWLMEARFGDLPQSRMFSPYIYAISRVTP